MKSRTRLGYVGKCKTRMLDVLVCSLFAERFLQLCGKYSPQSKKFLWSFEPDKALLCLMRFGGSRLWGIGFL